MAVAGDPRGGYKAIKQQHDRAYSLISEALDIDESGIGKSGV